MLHTMFLMVVDYVQKKSNTCHIYINNHKSANKGIKEFMRSDVVFHSSAIQ